MEYELLFFTSIANEERISEIKKEIEEILAGQGGKVSAAFSDIGKRKFAHPIKRQTHGFFSFGRFDVEDKDKLPDINRRLALNNDIMRHLIVRTDEIGKPIGADLPRATERTVSPSAPRKRKPEAEKIKVPTQARTADMKPKAEMKDLDEKLSEILEETPE